MSWKYNLEKHCVDEQPIDLEGAKRHPEIAKEVYKSIPVSGKVDWKDGQPIEEVKDFDIRILNGVKTAFPTKYKKDFIKNYFPDEPIKQEQPQHTASEIITGQAHEIDSLRVQIRKMVEAQQKSNNNLPKGKENEKL